MLDLKSTEDANPNRTVVNDEIDFESYSSEQIIEHLINIHHAYLKNKIPGLLSDGNDLMIKFRSTYPELMSIIELFDSLAEELLMHLEEEETVLFPLFSISDQSNALKKIDQTEIEHEEARGTLKQLNYITDGFNCPYQDKLINKYYENLHEFSNMLYAHIHIESNILFPRLSN